jgi:hypothetical protein
MNQFWQRNNDLSLMIRYLHVFRHGFWISAIWPLHVAHDSCLIVDISEITQEAIQLHCN